MSAGWRLRRVWPRGPDRLALEWLRADGTLLAGQWFRDPDRLRRVARTTRRAAAGAYEIPARGLLLQPRGADRRLRLLPQLVARADTTLLVHRPERRAVLRLGNGDERRYLKVVRPERVAALAAAHRHVAAAGQIRMAALEGVDTRRGLLEWAALEGRPLYELRGERLVAGAHAAGRALRRLHESPPPPDAPRHGGEDEQALLLAWVARTAAFFPHLAPLLERRAHSIAATLRTGGGERVLLHRDFYDKQILVDENGQVGLLDFDTLAVGEPALDIANGIEHFLLRARQGRVAADEGHRAAAAFLAGYAPDDETRRRLPAYRAATRCRLACLYAFRPGGGRLVLPLLNDDPVPAPRAPRLTVAAGVLP